MSSILVVDSSCPLPPKYLQRHNIKVISHTVSMFSKTRLVSSYSEQEAAELYESGLMSFKNGSVVTNVPKPRQISDLFLDQIVTDHETAVCITTTSWLSELRFNFKKALVPFSEEMSVRRSSVGVTGPCTIKGVTSGNIAAGYGLLTAYAARLLQKGVIDDEFDRRFARVMDLTHTLAVIPDLDLMIKSIENRDAPKALQAINELFGSLSLKASIKLKRTPILSLNKDQESLLSQTASYDRSVIKLFSHTEKLIKQGLQVKAIVVAYAGDPIALMDYRAYQKLKVTAEQNGVKVVESVISVSDGLILGPRTVTVGVAPRKPLKRL